MSLFSAPHPILPSAKCKRGLHGPVLSRCPVLFTPRRVVLAASADPGRRRIAQYCIDSRDHALISTSGVAGRPAEKRPVALLRVVCVPAPLQHADPS